MSLKRKLIGVRPESLIVATCASYEHAKETCAQRGARTLAIRGWRDFEKVAKPASYLKPKGESGQEHDVKRPMKSEYHGSDVGQVGRLW